MTHSRSETPTYTLAEVGQKYLPSKILYRLEPRLAKVMNVQETGEYIFTPDQDDQKTGSFRFRQTRSLLGDERQLEKAVQDHYASEGFRVTQQPSGLLAEKDGQAYSIIIMKLDNLVLVSINTASTKKLTR